MRRLLSLSTILFTLIVMLIPVPVTAQGWDPCGDAANGDYPAGYEVVWNGNGGAGNQVILGSDDSETLKGGPGNDIICGYGGEDILVGGTGNDWLDGGSGSDVLKGGSGNDSLVNGETNQPGSGNDSQFTIAGLSPCEQLAVNAGYDLGDFDNVVEGVERDEILTYQMTDGTDLVCGFGGVDETSGLYGGDVFFGGAGNDLVYYMDYGGVFHGGDGDDRVNYLFGPSTFYGGGDTDTVDEASTEATCIDVEFGTCPGS